MNENNNGQAPATDDQELAQVLAGMNQQATTDQPVDQPATDQPAADQTTPGLQFEETGASEVTAPAPEVVSAPETITEPTPAPATEPFSIPAPSSSQDAATVSTASPELEAIKKDALAQLRPLVDKLDLPAQEKFDTLLLIIRSTDDQSLLTAANEAAKLIEDETKRAEALLDIIKEIDFFSHPAQ